MEDLTLDKILFQSCYNEWREPDFDWSTWDNKTKSEWREYRIETHCLAYIVIAKLNPGTETYTIKSYKVVDN